jgi:hypothetical protein
LNRKASKVRLPQKNNDHEELAINGKSQHKDLSDSPSRNPSTMISSEKKTPISKKVKPIKVQIETATAAINKLSELTT